MKYIRAGGDILHKGFSIGGIAIVVGIFIILAIVLPPQFWWFILGVSLICFGIKYRRG